MERDWWPYFSYFLNYFETWRISSKEQLQNAMHAMRYIPYRIDGTAVGLPTWWPATDFGGRPLCFGIAAGVMGSLVFFQTEMFWPPLQKNSSNYLKISSHWNGCGIEIQFDWKLTKFNSSHDIFFNALFFFRIRYKIRIHLLSMNLSKRLLLSFLTFSGNFRMRSSCLLTWTAAVVSEVMPSLHAMQK